MLASTAINNHVAIEASQADLEVTENVGTADQAMGAAGLVRGKRGEHEGLATAIGLEPDS